MCLLWCNRLVFLVFGVCIFFEILFFKEETFLCELFLFSECFLSILGRLLVFLFWVVCRFRFFFFLYSASDVFWIVGVEVLLVDWDRSCVGDFFIFECSDVEFFDKILNIFLLCTWFVVWLVGVGLVLIVFILGLDFILLCNEVCLFCDLLVCFS